MENVLEDDKIILRAVEPTDLDVLYKWENDTAMWKVGASIAPFSRKVLWDYINNYTPDIYTSQQLRLMVELKETGEAIGTLDFYDFDFQNRRAGIGVLIDSGHSGKGYGTRALNLATEYGTRFIGLHQMWATIPIDNTVSVSLFKKCGYKMCGRLRSWLRRGKSYCDVYFMQLLVN